MINKKYNPDDVLKILKTGAKTSYQIRTALGCSQSTIDRLLAELDGRVVKENVLSDRKPLWMWRLK